MSLPTVEIIGNVKFMDTKFLPSGKQLTSLQVQCSEKRKDGTWDNLNIKAEFWEASAKFVNDFFNDGDVIIVTGKLITNTFESNGQKRSEIKFHFPQASFPPKSKSDNQQPQQSYQAKQPTYEYQNAQGQAPQQPPEIDIDDSLPF